MEIRSNKTINGGNKMETIKKLSKMALLVLLTVGFSANVLEAMRAVEATNLDAEQSKRFTYFMQDLSIGLQTHQRRTSIQGIVKKQGETVETIEFLLSGGLITDSERNLILGTASEEAASLAEVQRLQAEEEDNARIAAETQRYQTGNDASLALALILQEEEEAQRLQRQEEENAASLAEIQRIQAEERAAEIEATEAFLAVFQQGGDFNNALYEAQGLEIQNQR